MDPSREFLPSEALLSDRLERLAERRRAAVQRGTFFPSSSSDDEEELPCCTAAHALRELLQGCTAELVGTPLPSGAEGGEQLGGGCESVEDSAVETLPPLPPYIRPGSALVLDTVERPNCSEDGIGSMPPQARLLGGLSAGAAQEAAAGESSQRAAKLHAADADVQEAEVSLQSLLLVKASAPFRRLLLHPSIRTLRVWAYKGLSLHMQTLLQRCMQTYPALQSRHTPGSTS